LGSDHRFILAFDTSAAQCAAALVRDRTILAQRCEPMARGQAERLLPLLEACLDEAGMDWRSLDALAVCTGPGNFTGIRISVAAARGLALSLGRPAIGVTLFEALAAGTQGPLLAVAPNPRGGFHAQVFRDGVAVGRPEAELAALPGLNAATFCVGAGAEEAARRLGLAASRHVALLAPASVALAASAKAADPAARPAPFYMRPADAAPSTDPLPALLDDA
jgi:tRNA threonylcarbamoyladenosine biosynthesis protein TsaB